MKCSDKSQIIVVVFLSIVLLNIFHISCPIKYISGISCAGCGMTRAWLSLLHLDFSAAFTYHPLFMLGPIVALLFIFNSYIHRKPRILIWSFLVSAFIIVYLLRLFVFPDNIVVANPADSIILKLFRRLF
ncbi:MAG: DUF2752 domain-containing protein [Clostridiales bacterium]|nr:DUF2752 domain-containing protein [Clostridiales bacterium]